MTLAVEFRGEQQAMSSKHTGVAPTTFNDYIKSVVAQEPTLTVDITPEPTDYMGQPVTITPEYLEANVDMDELHRIFGERLVKGMNERLRSGELAPQEEIDEQHRRINEIVAMRMPVKPEDERYVWFTFRRDGRYNYIDWPVASYAGHSRWDIWHAARTEKVLTRLKKNRTITHISVTGKLPKHWYQTAL